MMRKRVAIWVLSVFVGVSLLASSGHCADVKVTFPVDEAMAVEKVKALFTDSISFYWGNTPHPAVEKTFGTFKTSKRTNAFAKARSNACGWAMASALVSLRDRAEREGANAVINIVSNIKDVEESSDTDFTCLAGKIMVNVALKGEVVTVAK